MIRKVLAGLALWGFASCASELSVVLYCCATICACCLFRCFVSAKSYPFPVNDYSSRELSFLGAPSNSTNTANIVGANPTVLGVLNVCTLSKIISAVVQSVMVPMVRFFSWAAYQYQSVHGNRWSSFVLLWCRIPPESVVSFSRFTPRSKPIPLRKPLKIFHVHDGVLALRQGNKSVGLVERLNNLVSFHGEFHWSTSNGLLKFSRYLSILSLLFIAPFAFSQNSTTVSGSIVDSGGQSWNNGTFTFTFVSSANNPVGPYSWLGGALQTTIVGTLSGTGTYSVSIPSNTAISPVNSAWTIRFCPQASAGCFTVSNVSITGGTLTVNATPPAILINVQAIPPPVLAYSTTEVTGAVIGSQFYLLGAGGGLQVCNAVSGNSCTTWAAAGGGGNTPVASLPATCTPGTTNPVQLTGSITVGVPPITYGPSTIFYCDSTNHWSPVSQGSGAGPNLAWYLSPQCPPSNSAQCFNTTADVQQINTCGWTGSTVTCTGSPFVAGDVGKTVMGWDKCQLFNSGGVGVNPVVSPGNSNTIAGFTNANVVTLTSAVATVEAGTQACFVWGHLDDAGADAFDTAVQAAAQCPKVMMAGTGYFFSRPHFFTVPASCSNLPYTFPFQTSLGNMFYSGGYELEGRGVGTTVWWLTPNFPGTGNCTKGALSKACFVIPVETRWSQFSITGGGDNSSQAHTLVAINGPASFDYMAVSNWNPGGGGSTTSCIGITGWVQFQQVINSQCGNIGIMADGGTAFLNATRLSIDTIHQWGVYVNWANGPYSFVCYECNFNITQNSSVGVQIHAATGVKLYRSSFNVAGTTPTNVAAISTNVAGATLDMQDTGCFMTGSASGSCIQGNAVMTTHLQNTQLNAAGTGNTYTDQGAGSMLVDECGNTGFGTGAGAALGNSSSSVINESCSANNTPITAAKLVLSAGWGSTAAWTALTGGDAPILGTITNSGTGQAASPTITYTFPTPYLVAPFSCTATQIGGTNTTLPFTSSALTKTGVTFTATGTPTAAATEIVQVTCVTP